MRGGAVVCNLCEARVPPEQPARWRKDGFDVVQCPSCGLVFRRTLPTRAELRELYGSGAFSAERGDASGYDDYLGDEDLHRLNADHRLRRLERLVTPGRLLDVGTAAGFFLHEARRRGWSVTGVDVSPHMAAYARERLELDVRTATLSEADVPPGSYDVVTMWDFIEHSLDPLGDLGRVRALLRPAGVVVMATGNVRSPVARLSGRRWHLLNPRYHNFYFSPRTLGALCRRAGLEVADVSHPGSRYSIRYLAHKLQTLAPGNTALGLVSRAGERLPWSGIGIPLNLWDIMTVVARRPAR